MSYSLYTHITGVSLYFIDITLNLSLSIQLIYMSKSFKVRSCHIPGDKFLPEPVMTQFTDSNIVHQAPVTSDVDVIHPGDAIWRHGTWLRLV